MRHGLGLSLLLAALLAASLGLKLVLRPPAADPHDFAARAETRLRARGFSDIRAIDPSMVFARRGGCEVLVVAISPDGWQRDALRRLAPDGARITVRPGAGGVADTSALDGVADSSALDGVADSSALDGVARRLADRLRRILLLGPPPVPQLALIENETCSESNTGLHDLDIFSAASTNRASFTRV